jgi:hypothetical protein
MSGVTVTTALAGAEQLIRALKLANPATKARVVAAIRKNTKAVAGWGDRLARRRSSGEMASTIRDTYSEDGLTGFVRVGLGKLPRRSKATTAKGITRAKGRTRKIGKGAYAPVVERGDPRRHHKAHPFLIPAYKPTSPRQWRILKRHSTTP